MDTAMSGISVGVLTAEGRKATRIVKTQRGQAAMLVPLIQEALAEAKTDFKSLDLIVSTIGPGSFTGLRIGLSTARSLGMALGIPVAGVNTLDLIATHYDTAKPCLILLETKRQDFYARYYDTDGSPLTDAFASDAETILTRAPVKEFVVGGDCLTRFKQCVSVDFERLEEVTQPDPIILAQAGLAQFEKDGEQVMPKPLYLRGADVSQPKTPPRQLEA